MRLRTLCVIAFAIPTAVSAQTALVRAVHQSTLPNGLAVIAIENHAVPLVTVEVVVRTGAFTQEPGDEGVPHLFEHMLFKSYVGEYGERFESDAGALDAEYNGSTGEERVNYFVTLPSSHLDAAMALLAQMIRDPIFTADNLNRERFVVLDEFNRDHSDPMFLLHDAVEERLWTTGWGRKNPLGEAKALWAATPKHLTEIFRRYYVPNNAAVIVSGDATAAAVALAAEKHFGHWARGGDPFAGHPVPPTPPLAKSAGVIQQGDVNDVVLLMEWQGPSVTADRASTYAADVLSTILDTPGSAFQRHLVDSGLFTSCTVGYQTLAHVGPISLMARTSIDSLPHALNALWVELTMLGETTTFTDEELANARQSRTVQSAFQLDDPTGIAHTAGYWWSIAGLDYFLDYSDRLGAVTGPQLITFVERYMRGNTSAIGVLVPNGKGESLRATVAAFVQATQQVQP